MTPSDRALLIDHVDALLQARETGYYLIVVRPRKLAGIEEAGGPAAVEHLLGQFRPRLAHLAGDDGALALLPGGTFALLRHVAGDLEDFMDEVMAVASRPARPLDDGLLAPANAAVCPIDPGLGKGRDHLEKALRALQQAMSRGPAGIEVVCDTRLDQAAADWEWRVLLEEAAMRGEFIVEYQPILSLATGEVTTVEALLRWESPRFGRVAPDRFVPTLEECGLIRPVGEWVLREVCRQARAWRESSGREVRVAVNVSPLQLAADFPETVRRILAETGCDASWIEIEITEGAIVRDFTRIRPRLEALVAMGFTLAIDDFGAGYSSLGQLAQLPFHNLKIDRSLIDGVLEGGKRAGIVRAVVALADGLGLAVTTEGVEDAAQAKWLAGLGDLHGQGFHFARPMAAEVLGPLLQRQVAAG